MAVALEVEEKLRAFLRTSAYASHGGVVTDLDGTVVHEDQGRVYIPPPVELALKELYDLGRPLILNSLRFPLSVLRTFGKEWYGISNAPIPTISMNGSQLGFVVKNDQGELEFEEITAFPLTDAEIEEALRGVGQLLAGGIKDVLVFYYPRDWRMGEIIWTPVPENVLHVKEKYVSASAVTAVEFAKLREQMFAQEVCMIFLLIDAPEDTLMAYQHTKRSNFFTRAGVNKLSGTEAMAAHLGVDLSHSVGAGDTEMDNFLSGVGLTLLVRNHELAFRGIHQTVKVRDSFEQGDILFRLAQIQRELLG
ncbi:MAG: HAD family phosphatase [Pyrinomonadaceae bacterium]